MPGKRLRGFQSGKIGPVDAGDYIGGNYAASVNFQTNLPFLFPSFQSVDFNYFVDAGNVFSSSCTERQSLLKNCSDFDTGELRYAAGLSVTYLSPFGPLTFYVAAPFGDKEGDDTKTFDFTVGTGF